MIDHVSIGVRDLASATEFYTAVLGRIDFKLLIEKPGTVGFGKTYPEFWLNHRPELVRPGRDTGTHICLRARSSEVIDEIYAQALEYGAESSGKPGYRPEYNDSYYACFIRDADGNHIEVVTFVQPTEVDSRPAVAAK